MRSGKKGVCICVSENKYDCGAENVSVRVCISVHSDRSVTHRVSSIRIMIKNKFLRCLICVAATTRPELVFSLVSKTSAGTSGEVGCGDCRHVCDDEESHREDLDEGDRVHDDHCSASSSEDCLVMAPCFTAQCVCIQGVLRSLRCRCLLLVTGVYDLVLVSVSPFCRRSGVIPLVICYSVKFFHVRLRVSLFVHAHLILLVLEVALHDRSATMLLAGIQAISRFLEFL